MQVPVSNKKQEAHTMYSDVVDYIRELYNTPEGDISLHEPKFNGREKLYLQECIDTTYVSSKGSFVDAFAEEICAKTGAAYAVPVVNGTSALHLALVGAGVQKDDEVITQPLTFIATANAISYIGAIPHFVDVDRDTLGMSPSKLRAYLEKIAEVRDGQCYNKESGKRISACVPMHTFGLPLHIEELVAVCEEYGIVLVEDAAESLGSSYKGKHTGLFGLMGVLSFNGNKIITSGGGGAILTEDKELAEKLKHLSSQAKVPHPYNYEHDHIGYNYRMPNINAALALAQLEQLDQFIEDKRKVHQRYAEFFANREGIDLIDEIGEAKSNYWLNAVLLENESKKEEFLEYMNDQGIKCRPIWKLINHLAVYQNLPADDLSNAEWLVERTVNICSSARTNGQA